MSDVFAGKVVLVTGASSGIGRAIAQQLGTRHARVGLIARRQNLLDDLGNDLKSRGAVSATAMADVADRDGLRKAIHSIREQLGPIDILIANAGVGTPTLLDPVNIADVELMIRVNLLGAIYSIEAVLPDMLDRRNGQLAAVSSLAAFKGLPGESGYCASKAALNVYMEGLRIQLRGSGVAVTVACPGFVKTPMTDVNDFPMPFLMTAERAAEHILWAIRRRKKMYRFPRPTSFLTRLLGCMPDWLVARTMSDYNEKPPMNDLSK